MGTPPRLFTKTVEKTRPARKSSSTMEPLALLSSFNMEWLFVPTVAPLLAGILLHRRSKRLSKSTSFCWARWLAVPLIVSSGSEYWLNAAASTNYETRNALVRGRPANFSRIWSITTKEWDLAWVQWSADGTTKVAQPSTTSTMPANG